MGALRTEYALSGRAFSKLPLSAEGPSSNWILILAPTAFASHTLSQPLGVLATLLLAAGAFWNSPKKHLTMTWACAILPLLALPIVLRWYDTKTLIKAGFFVLAVFIIAQAVHTASSKVSAVVSIVDGAGLFAFASVVLWSAGFEPPASRESGLWNTLTGGKRIIFPLSTSLSASPEIAAVFLAGVVPILIAYKRHRLPRLVAAGCAVAILVLANSHTGMIAVAFISGGVLLFPQLLRRISPFAVGFLLITPFVFEFVRQVVLWGLATLHSIAPWLVLPTLNRRENIWTNALAHYLDRVDWIHQMIGFGAGGQAKSGATGYYWERKYSGISSVEFASPHNSMLQMVFDGGWLTVAIFIATVVGATWALARSAATIAGTAALLALVLDSMTGTALSPSHQESTWWLLVGLAMVAFAKDASPSGSGPGRIPGLGLRGFDTDVARTAERRFKRSGMP